MNLRELYLEEGAKFLTALHDATGINRKYLYQCATGRRRPSPEYAIRLVEADPRMTLDEIYKQGTSNTTAQESASDALKAK